MTRQEFEEAARRYREEMFRLYAERQFNPPPAPTADPQPPPMPPLPAGSAPPAPATESPAAEPVRAEQGDFPPMTEPDAAPEPSPAEPEPDGTIKPEADGGILVHVRTARGAEPVAGAAVIITQERGGEQILISVRNTDDCGDVPEVRVPAPPSSADQQHPAYALYDISVYADGFYREHSKDVPVFEGVVSVQNFDLIPLPAGQDDPYTGSRTHYNNLPGI